MLIDDFLPAYDVREQHGIAINAPIATVYAAVRRLDLRRARLSMLLLRMRGIGVARPLCFTLEDFLRMGFSILAERPNSELLIGLAGRFWSLTGNLRPIDRDSFRRFNEPGAARAAWNFTLAPQQDGSTILSTETRVQCTDAAARRRFTLYWLLVGPFSGMIRRDMLRELKRQAETERASSLP